MSRSGQTFLCGDGAFRLPNGVTPESVLHRCREYASYVEGRLWCIDKKSASRNEADICAELGMLFRAITSHVRVGGASDENRVAARIVCANRDQYGGAGAGEIRGCSWGNSRRCFLRNAKFLAGWRFRAILSALMSDRQGLAKTSKWATARRTSLRT